MTAPRFRPRHPRDPRAPAFTDDRDVTETIGARADWDGRTYAWGGASDIGLPDGGVGYDANGWDDPAPGTGPPVRVRTRQPAPVPPAAAPAPRGTVERDMTRGWPHLFEVRCAYPAAACDNPIPCGAAHRDAAAGSFRALRRSAQAAGWHLDALGRWACARCCQASPEYRTLYPVMHYDMIAAEAYVTGDLRGEVAHRAAAEHGLFRDVLDTARRGRHAGTAR